MVTLAEAAACALRVGPETVGAGGAEVVLVVVVTGSAGGVTGAGVVVVVPVVVVAGVVVVVPTSWAAETAGTTQIAARTSIPLARALAPFTLLILRSIDS
jgi:hypothetical protein